MNDRYELKLYDEKLVAFELKVDTASGYKIKILEKHGSEALFPIDLKLNETDMLRWLQKRTIPKNRTFVNEILETLDLSINDTKGIIDVCKGLSLNDSYWIVPEGFGGKFSEYNLYENRFSEILSLVAYTGVTQNDAAFSTSPELTTNGMLPKAWRYIENEGIFLYKGGSSGFANTGKEPYIEYYASQIAEKMELDAVKYDLEKWKGILASKCRLFTNINISFVPIGRIVREGGLDKVSKYYKELGEEFDASIRDMLVFDALIYNDDRHYGNFGILRDNHTGKIIAPAPIFDNGVSLFNYAMPDDYENLDEYAKTRMPHYPGTTYEGICQKYITKRQVEKLRKMLDFSFKRHEKYNLPEEHVMAIEKHIRKRAGMLLDIAEGPIG